MPVSSYREIGGPDGKLARMVPFNGNSMSGAQVGDVYSVRSYATEIARVVRTDAGFVKFCSPSGTYSPTTSRQQNACRAWLPGVLVDVERAPTGGELTTPDPAPQPA